MLIVSRLNVSDFLKDVFDLFEVLTKFRGNIFIKSFTSSLSCHSEERSDEESEYTKYMPSDTSLTLRMTSAYKASDDPK